MKEYIIKWRLGSSIVKASSLEDIRQKNPDAQSIEEATPENLKWVLSPNEWHARFGNKAIHKS